jgi:hypothetical protein
MKVYFYGQIRKVAEECGEFRNVDSIEKLIKVLIKEYGSEFKKRFTKNDQFNGNITILLDGLNISQVENKSDALKSVKIISIFEIIGGG